MQEGTELLAVGDDRRKELLVSVSHDRIDEVTPRLGQAVRLRTGAWNTLEGVLARVEPRASDRLPHPALSATVGGPLAVTETVAATGQAEAKLVEPRFPGVIDVSPEIASQLACGDRGYAILGLGRDSVGQHVWTRFARWLRQLDELRRQ